MGAFLFNSLGRVWAGVLDMGVPIATKFALILLSQPSHQVWGRGTPPGPSLKHSSMRHHQVMLHRHGWKHTLIDLTGSKLLLIASAM